MKSFIPFLLFIAVWILLYKYLVNKKQKGKIISHLVSFVVSFFVLGISASIISPLTPEQLAKMELEKQQEEIIEKKELESKKKLEKQKIEEKAKLEKQQELEAINKEDIKEKTVKAKALEVFKIEELPKEKAIKLYIGDENNHIDIKIHRENIEKGFKLNTKIKPTDRYYISTKAYWNGKYYDDNNENAYVIFEIFDLIPETKFATLFIEINLKGSNTLFNQTPVYIKNKIYDDFVKNIK